MKQTKKTLTIDDLLASLNAPKKEKSLENTAETWSRIGSKDSFEELELENSELNDFLKAWIDDNPYNNI